MFSAGLIKAGMFESQDKDARRLVKRLNHQAKRHDKERDTTKREGREEYEGWKR